MNSPAYWKGKCEKCKYAIGFSTHYGLCWHCDKFDVVMAGVGEKQCPGNKYYPRDDKTLITDLENKK